MKVTINGEVKEFPQGLTLLGLLVHLGLLPERVALERNRQIIPRARWPEVYLVENDSLEIVQFVGGG